MWRVLGLSWACLTFIFQSLLSILVYLDRRTPEFYYSRMVRALACLYCSSKAAQDVLLAVTLAVRILALHRELVPSHGLHCPTPVRRFAKWFVLAFEMSLITALWSVAGMAMFLAPAYLVECILVFSHGAMMLLAVLSSLISRQIIVLLLRADSMPQDIPTYFVTAVNSAGQIRQLSHPRLAPSQALPILEGWIENVGLDKADSLAERSKKNSYENFTDRDETCCWRKCCLRSARRRAEITSMPLCHVVRRFPSVRIGSKCKTDDASFVAALQRSKGLEMDKPSQARPVRSRSLDEPRFGHRHA
ncbi:hypothetical protein IE81DRAFT_324029 [Ceraceosorus guamensis]|uniref:Uncharacterized protein n=1 Tax=Ceraceosorus guamensis TaxID=1522189 RepID=A0A316VWN8_9BASI|nr:hypothetical protein IE81DRAFT_324029 [Ceraceosorus guamensis]PWN41862.1 hypothetical protein IE81DRAFT_324029 [Ceraceosorus guamensis]